MSRSWVIVLTILAAVAPAHAGVSNSLLDVSADGKRLLTANAENGTVSVVDLTTRKVTHEIPVGDRPEGVTWIGAGDLAAATVYRENCVVVFDAASGKVVKRIKTAAEPYGVVAAADGKRLYVSHEYPGLVSEIDPEKGQVVREWPAGARPRGLCLSTDGRRLYVVEWLTATLHAVDLAEGKIVDTWRGHEADSLARHVVVHPTRAKAYVSHQRSRVEINDSNGSILPRLAVVDLVERPGKRRTSFGMDSFNGMDVVASPWEAALSADGRRLYTLYAGTDDLNVSEVIDDDYEEIRRVGRLRNVGHNPRALRLSPDGGALFFYNTLDFEVGVYDPTTVSRLARIKVCSPPKTPEWVRGAVLFNTALDPLTSRHWVACASCHPDGQADGRVWQNPEGLRKTTALFGVAHTHPLHWSADRDEVQDFEYTIRGRLMRGQGLLQGPIKPKRGLEAVELTEHLAGRSRDLDALAVYSNSFDFVLSPHIPAPGKLFPAAERGKALFFDAKVGCAQCHSGPYYTDSRLEKPFKLHDVGTAADDPTEKNGPRYDTPTLLGVYRTAPYLHTGKAATLRDVLTTCNVGDKHGVTSGLKEGEVDDLVAFLKSLPYEKPPDETPNTVKYRVPARKE